VLLRVASGQQGVVLLRGDTDRSVCATGNQRSRRLKDWDLIPTKPLLSVAHQVTGEGKTRKDERPAMDGLRLDCRRFAAQSLVFASRKAGVEDNGRESHK
jgi:hypothetical protein